MSTSTVDCDGCKFLAAISEETPMCGHPRNLGWWKKVAIMVTADGKHQGIGCPIIKPLGLIETAI